MYRRPISQPRTGVSSILLGARGHVRAHPATAQRFRLAILTPVPRSIQFWCGGFGAARKRTGSDHHVGRPRGRASSPRRSSASRSREHPSSIHERKQHARARPWIHAWSRWRATCECRIAPARCSRAPQAPGLTIPLVAVCRAWFFAPSLFWRLCLVSTFAGRRSRPRR